VKAMLIDSDEAIKRMQNVIEHYKKYGYMEEVMYRMAVGHCIAVVREMAGENNDIGRVHSISSKRVLRAKAKKQKSTTNIEVSD
jgi:stage III sporulation protein SpoIIIAA